MKPRPAAAPWVIVLVISLALNGAGLFMVTGYRDLVDDLRAQVKDAAKPAVSPAVQDCQLTPWCNQDGSITVIVNGYHPHVMRCGAL